MLTLITLSILRGSRETEYKLITFSVPRVIHFDRGRRIRGKTFLSIMRECGGCYLSVFNKLVVNT